MAKPELMDTGTNGRYARRDERGRFKESEDAGRSPSADRRQPTMARETDGVHPLAPLAALAQEGVAELVAATREQTAAIERQTAVFERLLTFLSPAAAAHDRQKAARDIAEADAAVRLAPVREANARAGRPW